MRPNLLDVLELLVFAAVIYRGYKSSFLSEVFKLLSVYFGVVIATHYYVIFGALLHKWLILVKPIENAVSFALLAGGFSLICPLMRDGWIAMMNVNPRPPVKSWLNICLASLRGYLICGMIFFGLVITNNEYFVSLTKSSFSRYVFKDVCPNVYKVSYDILLKQIFPAEIFNMDAENMIEKSFQALQSNEASAGK